MTRRLLTLLCLLSTSLAHAATPDYTKERADRAHSLTTPYGWFSLIALESLKPGLTRIGSARSNDVVLASAPPHLMTLQQTDGKVMVVQASRKLTLRGKPLARGAVIPAEDESNAAALVCGTLHLWAIDRGGRRYLRVKDSSAPALHNFHGLSFYAPDPRYVVEARWIPYDKPHTMQVLNKLGQITPMPVPGYVEFTLDGQREQLTPMTADADSLWFVFRDKTAPRSTDGGGRFLVTGGPSNGLSKPGTVTLDFNEAENPPCAYSPYATCPVASPENRLALEVPAGEKVYE